ncbi:GNAT family N-acetyltransferase [Haloarcula sp. JP-L23]|uniref:GNAT family N-acetyltransferase n=1 Tax=Haloarcula sp. JP-L23 TaxID=2716717 RepID=UPI00140E9EB4|nr:GNAT family N-acetyltransferase [Haloarcula sp. JP-L23]
MFVRDATVADLPDVMNVLDGAALSIDVETVRESIAEDGTLVACEGGERSRSDERPGGPLAPADGERVLGALVLDGDHVAAVAVRRRRRGQGIGTALVEAAAERRQRLTAAFDADVKPFYEGLGFTVETVDEAGRWRGTRSTDG